jgi:hypothetical protein
MELRSAEDELSALTIQYESVRRSRIIMSNNITVDDAAEATTDIIEADWCESLPAVSSPIPPNDQQDESDNNFKHEISLEEVLQQLELLRDRLQSLEPKAAKFRKRMKEIDPITNAPRYGEKTMSRVKAFLETFGRLTSALSIAFGNTPDEDAEQRQVGRLVPVELMRQRLKQEREAARQAELEEEERQRQEKEQKSLEEQRISQSLRRQEEQERLQRLQEEQELARRAEESRRARLQAEQAQLESERRQREESERADREWMAGILKGPDGVREQLAVLKESTAAEPCAHETALTALHTLFSQIVAHPEEEKFRRVRRDHPKFNEDIGRHSGGRELLIAAGFRLGAVDETPCFISTEPNVEKDLDGWSAWFDLLKTTVDILEEEMLK